MNKWSTISIFVIALTIGMSFPVLHAQYIIEQVEYNVPLNYDWIPENVEFDNPLDELRFFLNIPEKKIEEQLHETGDDIVKRTSITYIDGDNFAYESEEETGKFTVISNVSKGTFYYVMWSQKKILEMSKDDMKRIQEKSKKVSEEMLSHLSPEMQEQVKKTMSEETQTKQKVKATGKKMTKYGYVCEQYLVESDENLTMVWATDDKIGLERKMKSLSEKMNAIFPSDNDEDEDEWELVPGKIPIEVRKIQTYNSEMTIESITKIKETKPAADKFIPPGEKEGFSRGSMMDMMKPMFEMMQGSEK